MSTFVLLTPDELAARDRKPPASRTSRKHRTHASPRHLTPEERNFLIQTHGTMTAYKQAEYLHIGYDVVCYQRQRLLKAGLISKETRKYGRPYSSEEDAQIAELMQQGYSIDRIARKLHRPFSSMVTHITMDLGGVRTLRGEETAQVRNTTETGQLLGVLKETVNKWIRRGWLTAQRNGRKRSRPTIALITDEALLEFMAKREYWPAWHPAAITDPDWQTYARDLRKNGDWVSCGTVARTHAIRITRVYAWLREERGQGITTLRYGQELFVWSLDVAALVEQIYAYDWEYGNFVRRADRDDAGRVLPQLQEAA